MEETKVSSTGSIPGFRLYASHCFKLDFPNGYTVSILLPHQFRHGTVEVAVLNDKQAFIPYMGKSTNHLNVSDLVQLLVWVDKQEKTNE